MRLTSILFKTKSVRNELLEMRIHKPKSFTDFLLWLYKERNFSIIDGIKKYKEERFRSSINTVNKFFEPDLNLLGCDLHAATYTLKLGGKCRLHGSSNWLSLQDKKIEDVLPNQRNENFRVEGLDLSKTVINSDGISNLEFCEHIKTLIFSECIFVDDWLLSRISHAFSNTLEYLDITSCQSVTDNGLLTLAYLKNLKLLKMAHLKNAKNKEYISILLEDNLANLVIDGTDHLSDEALKTIEQKLLDEENQLRKIIAEDKIN